MHKSRLAGFIIDCHGPDLDGAARFWGAALGLGEAGQEGDRYERLDASARDLHVEVQRVDHPSRVHLDIETDDLDAEVARLEALGARRVAFVRALVGDGGPHRPALLRGAAPRLGRQGRRQRLAIAWTGRRAGGAAAPRLLLAVGGQRALVLPDVDPGDGDPAVLGGRQARGHLLVEEPGDQLGGGVELVERRDLVDVLVVEAGADLGHQPLQVGEVDHHADLVEHPGPDEDPDPPVVAVQPLALAAVEADLVRRGEDEVLRDLEHR